MKDDINQFPEVLEHTMPMTTDTISFDAFSYFSV